MLVKALKQEHSARRYRFTQIPELIQCLLVRGLRGDPPAGAPRAARAALGGGDTELGPSCRRAPPALTPQAILQKEPNFLATLFRQKIILVIMELR